MKSQVQRIITVLEDGNWHCTSEFYKDFMADPRRRMVDIQDKGYKLESRPCQSHNYHDGHSKEWRIADKPIKTIRKVVIDEITRVARMVEVTI